MFSLLPLWGLDPLNSPLILQPIFTYANNATAQYGLDIPYNLSWTPHHLGHWPSNYPLPIHNFHIVPTGQHGYIE